MHNYEIAKPKDFLLAGKALFTIRNEETKNRFTFKVTKSKNGKVFFVSVLNGSDNNSNYAYIGTIFGKDGFKWTPKSKVTRSCQSFKVFEWLIKNVDDLPEFIKIYHEGKCGRCGRKLTVPESVLSGFGPECIGKVNMTHDHHKEEMMNYGFVSEAEMQV